MQEEPNAAQLEEMKRTTVSFEDDQYEALERWAQKEVRTVPNLITAIVVSSMRGESPRIPEDVKRFLEDREKAQ